MAEFSFLLPPGHLSHEGGGAYVRMLARALNAAGHHAHLDGAGSGEAVRVIDGAGLAALPLDQVRGAVGLIHHPSALAERDGLETVRAAERERMGLLRRIIATSAAVGERLVNEFGADPGRVSVVRPGVPDAGRSSGSGGAGCTVLSLGALVPRKGHAVLLRALARLFDLPWQLVLVGDATRDLPCADALRQQADAPGLVGRIRFAGVLDDAALEAEWRRADVFALATEWEGYSAPVAEALRRGLPVAVTNGGATAELVAAEMGVVVTPGDHDGLSKALRRVIFDEALRADMADAAWRAGRLLPDWPTQAAHFVEAASA